MPPISLSPGNLHSINAEPLHLNHSSFAISELVPPDNNRFRQRRLERFQLQSDTQSHPEMSATPVQLHSVPEEPEKLRSDLAISRSSDPGTHDQRFPLVGVRLDGKHRIIRCRRGWTGNPTPSSTTVPLFTVTEDQDWPSRRFDLVECFDCFDERAMTRMTLEATLQWSRNTKRPERSRTDATS